MAVQRRPHHSAASHPRGRDLNKLPVGLGLNQAVDVVVPNIIPHSLSLQLQGVTVLASFEMVISMTSFVPSTPNMATNKADPD